MPGGAGPGLLRALPWARAQSAAVPGPARCQLRGQDPTAADLPGPAGASGAAAGAGAAPGALTGTVPIDREQ